MAIQAAFSEVTETLETTATVAAVSGEVLQLNDGRAAVVDGLNSVAAGEKFTARVTGKYNVAKHTSMVFLPGQRVWWDNTSNSAVIETDADKTFFLGTTPDGAATAASTMIVDLNADHMANDVVNMVVSGWDKQKVGSAGVAAGVERVDLSGSEIQLVFGTTAEAQTVSALSRNSVAITDDYIFEAYVEIVANGDHSSSDLNIGLANADHASDADSITESVFFHIDGASLNIMAESDDGTTEVAATDTTVDAVVGTEFLVQIDGRNQADHQLYINGVNVLPSSVFTLAAATGPMKILCHMEKTSNDTAGTTLIRRPRLYKAGTTTVV